MEVDTEDNVLVVKGAVPDPMAATWSCEVQEVNRCRQST